MLPDKSQHRTTRRGRNTSDTPARTTVTAAFAMATALLCAVTACGSKSADGKDQRVPSLSSGAAGTSPGPSAAAEKVLIPIDASPEEVERLHAAYLQCLIANGADNDQLRRKMQQSENNPAWVKATQACVSKEPEEPWARSMRTDPNYRDKLHAWVSCANEHGIKAHESKDGFFSFDEGLPQGDKERAFKECERKAFGG